jgi:hypothetical protein
LVRAKRELLAHKDAMNYADDIAYLVSALAYVGNEEAWTGYKEIVLGIDPARRGTFSVLDPLWQHPDDPHAAEILSTVFLPESAFSARDLLLSGGFSLPMVAFLPQFRSAAAAVLEDKEVVARATRTFEQSMSIRYPGGGIGGSPVDPATASVPVGGVVDVRACDLAALRLARMMKIEEYSLALPVARRDELIARILRVVKSDDTMWLLEAETGRPNLPWRFAVFPTRAVWPSPPNGIRPRASSGG